MAASPSSTSAVIQKEEENFYRACSIVLALCPKLLREGLEHYVPARACPTRITLSKGAPNFFPGQLTIISNISTIGSYDECDISLLYILYQELVKGVKFKPTKGWRKVPPATATLLADDLERIRDLRNNRIGHCKDNRMTDADYTNFLTDVNNMMTRADNNYGG